MNQNKEYQVIWIDDKCKERDFDAIITDAALDDIVIKAYEYGKDGLEELANNFLNYDGIILDVKCKYDTSELDTAANFYRILSELNGLMAEKHRVIPYFVYSAQPDIHSNSMFEMSLSGKILYKKGEDDEILLRDIKTEADKLLETRIKQKYLKNIRFAELYQELIEILTFVENEVYDNLDPISKSRFVLNWVMDYLNKIGVLPIVHNGSNLNACSTFLGKKEMRNYVPVYVQRSLHSVVEVSNNGSHRIEVFDAVRSGNAPYLVRSTVFELLTILKWCGSLSEDEASIAKRKEEIAKIAPDYVYEGAVEKDEFNNYHCGEYLITYSLCDSEKLEQGDIVRIKSSMPNKKKAPNKPYEIIAKDVEKI